MIRNSLSMLRFSPVLKQYGLETTEDQAQDLNHEVVLPRGLIINRGCTSHFIITLDNLWICKKLSGF